MTNRNPNRLSDLWVQSRTSGSVFEMRKIPSEQPPSASNIPARNPRLHSALGHVGQRTPLQVMQLHRPPLVVREPGQRLGQGQQLLQAHDLLTG